MSNLEDSNKLLYQFQKIDRCLISNLSKNQLFFQHPTKFNDPFDCKIDYYLRGSIEKWFEFLDGHHPDEIKRILNDHIEADIFEYESDEIAFYPTSERRINVGGDLFYASDFKKGIPEVCCFSEINNSILMWSHYANNHKGICLSFRSKLIEERHCLELDSHDYPFIEVFYSKNTPSAVNMLEKEERGRKLSEFLITKHSDWEYEHEYRLLNIEPKNSKSVEKKYNKQSLEGVIFGLNTSEEDMQSVYEVIEEHYIQEGIDVNIYKMQGFPKNYSIKMKPITKFDIYS